MPEPACSSAPAEFLHLPARDVVWRSFHPGLSLSPMPASPFHLLPRPLHTLPAAVSRILLRTLNLNDPWRRFRMQVPLSRYGAGSVHPFTWYLTGRSTLHFTSLKDVSDWLSSCTYARDPELFHECDYWQHPLTFERIRMGDCEDFSLWTWRRLRELGLPAEFVAGRCVDEDGALHGHTWVQFEDPQGRYVFDPVIPDAPLRIRPLPAVRDRYLPEVSVDGRLRRYAYAGFFLLRRDAPREHVMATPGGAAF